MSQTIKKLGPAQVELDHTIATTLLKQVATQVVDAAVATAEIAGFRKGKVPRQLVIEAVGIMNLKQRIVSQAITTAMHAMIDKEHLTPLTQPAIAIVEDFTVGADATPQSPLRFSARFEVMPAVAIGDYKKLALTKKELEPTRPADATDEEMQKILDHLRRQKAELIETKGTVKQGDWVEVSFKGSVGGVVKEAYVSQHYPLIIGSNAMVAGFEDQLVGTTLGQSKTFNLKIDEEQKPVAFTVTVNQHKAVKLPEINDEFIKSFGQQSLAELKAAIGQSITKERQALARHRLEDLVVKKLLDRTKTELPASLVERELERMIGRLRDDVMSRGISFEQYLAQQKQTIEDLRTTLLPQAEYAVKTGLALAQVAKQEGIDASRAEATQAVLEKLISYAVK